jgi:hypothetical protein
MVESAVRPFSNKPHGSKFGKRTTVGPYPSNSLYDIRCIREATMSDEPVPMLNTPVVAASAALAAIGITAETPEEQEQLNDRVKEAFFAHVENLLGFKFDRETGEPNGGEVEMDDKQKYDGLNWAPSMAPCATPKELRHCCVRWETYFARRSKRARKPHAT